MLGNKSMPSTSGSATSTRSCAAGATGWGKNLCQTTRMSVATEAQSSPGNPKEMCTAMGWCSPRAQATSTSNIWLWTSRTSITLRRRATSDTFRVLRCATAWKGCLRFLGPTAASTDPLTSKEAISWRARRTISDASTTSCTHLAANTQWSRSVTTVERDVYIDRYL